MQDAVQTNGASSADPREHFLASLIVAFLNSNSGVLDNDGFVNGHEIMLEMTRHGFLEDQVRSALRRLATKRLLETPHAHYRELAVDDHEPPEQFHFRATSVGVYHIRFWTGSFAFLDAVSTDTPIFDQEYRDKISKLAPSFEIKERYEKATCFKKYLENLWHISNFIVTYYDFPSLIQSQEYSFLSVQQVIERNSEKNTSRS